MPSEVIKTFRYDESSATLFVTFQSGQLYAYGQVEPECPEAMTDAFSKGEFFGQYVRGYYPYGKVDDPAAVVFRPAERDIATRPALPRGRTRRAS
jgi:hypothetical protein